MSSDSSPVRSLPSQANLEQQKKRARELLAAAQAREADALGDSRRINAPRAEPKGEPPERMTLQSAL